MAGATATRVEAGSQELGQEIFWKVPLSPEWVHFVDSADSESFALLLQALERATVIAMDAEWKPSFDKTSGAAHPRVSILQIACRGQKSGRGLSEGGNGSFQDSPDVTEVSPSSRQRGCRAQGGNSVSGGQRKWDERARNLDGGRAERFGVGRAGSGNNVSEFCQRSNWDDEDKKAVEIVSMLFGPPLANGHDAQSGECREPQVDGGSRGDDGARRVGGPAASGATSDGGRRGREHGATVQERNAIGKGKRVGVEMIFLLDLLALPAAAFSEALKRVFVDPEVLKLGFRFKQDLAHLRASFPGSGLHGCFDKVEPYLDIGKLYLHLHRNSVSFVHRGKRIFMGGDGLASISETMLGLPLRKEMQCSNWELRPLTEEQIDYATADAYCLLAIFDALQIQASEHWFSPVLAGDGDSFVRSEAKVGVAEVLSRENLEASNNSSKFALANVCRPKRGNASTMVQAALGQAGLRPSTRDSNGLAPCRAHLPASKALGVDQLIRRFGERLLISDALTTKNKRLRRKARSRRAREAGKCMESQEEYVQYVGPPPWDTAGGGDGIPRFLCDAMVEGLARQLRCVGVDAASLNSKKCEARELVDLAEKEGRVILTRDVKLLRRRLVPRNLACRVRRQGKWDQLAEIIETFNLMISEDQLLTRCTKCNGHFVPTALSAKEAAARAPSNQVIPECALENVEEFWQCGTCKHVYWQVHATWADRFHHNIHLKARNSLERTNSLLQSVIYEDWTASCRR